MVTNTMLRQNRKIKITINGLTPACSIGQHLPDGRWWIIDEFVTDDCGIIRFSEKLSQYMQEHYPEFDVQMGWGDYLQEDDIERFSDDYGRLDAVANGK